MYSRKLKNSLWNYLPVGEEFIDYFGANKSELKPGYYSRILNQLCKIEFCDLNMRKLGADDRQLFLSLPRLNRFTPITNRAKITKIENDFDIDLYSLEALIDGIHFICESWKREKIAGLKLSQANYRKLDFQKWSYSDAENVYLKKLNEQLITKAEGNLLEDYLLFACCEVASECQLTIQFHIDMRANINRNLCDAQPIWLTPL